MDTATTTLFDDLTGEVICGPSCTGACGRSWSRLHLCRGSGPRAVRELIWQAGLMWRGLDSPDSTARAETIGIYEVANSDQLIAWVQGHGVTTVNVMSIERICQPPANVADLKSALAGIGCDIEVGSAAFPRALTEPDA